MGKVSYKLVESDSELKAAFEVRRQVFVAEQGVPEDLEFDDHENEALHTVAKDGERVVGTARILFLNNRQAKLERMAILKPFRRKGIGSRIIAFLNEELRNREVKRVVLHAQLPVVAFYESCGFEISGTTFWEVGIKHIKMRRRL